MGLLVVAGNLAVITNTLRRAQLQSLLVKEKGRSLAPTVKKHRPSVAAPYAAMVPVYTCMWR
jgi:hypothetical protein